MAVELTLETTKYELVLVPETHELVLQTTVVEITLNLVSGFQGIADVKTDSTIEGAGTTTSPLSIQTKVNFLISLIAQIAPALEISNVAVTYTDELVVVITTTGGLTPITKTWELVGQTLTVSAVDVIEQADTEIIDLADVYPIVISNVAVTYDNGFIVDVTATGGFGELETTFIRVGENLEITVTDQIGIVATTIYDLAAESPLVIDSLTFEVEGETAVITCVASGGWGVLTYTLGVESNTTGIFEVTENDTYTINVVDELATGDVSDSIEVELFPLEKSDLLVWVDQSSAATLTNKIAGIGDVTVGTNLVPNGDCEGNWGYTHFINIPSTLERSNEQAHSGTYSWKVGMAAIQNPQGITSPVFTTKTGEVVTYSFWIRRYAGSGLIRWAVGEGDGAGNSASGSLVLADTPLNTWVQVTGSYTELSGGASAKLIVYLTTTIASFYIDDVTFTVPNVTTIKLSESSSIYTTLINATKYYSGVNPLPVRITEILHNENNQMFFNDDYKILLYNKQVYGNTLLSALDWIGYDIFDTITNIKTVKIDGTGDYLTIPAAIAGIVDASAAKPYRIDVYDDFTITEKASYTADGSYFRYIKPTAHIYINGVGVQKKITCSIPNTATDNETTFYEPIAMLFTGGVKNFHVTMKNGRYALHADGLTTNSTQYYKDCIFEHLGNQEVIDYRIANSQGYANVFGGYNGIGCGTSSGVKMYFDNVESKGIKGMFIHNNNSFPVAHYMQFNRSKFTASGIFNTNENPTSAILECLIINCLNSDKININEHNTCQFNSYINYNALVNDSGLPSGISYILADISLIGKENTGHSWNNISTAGGSLFIGSNTNGSVVITGGTAESVIMPTAEAFNYGRLGQMEVGEWAKNPAMKLGVRLGDCSGVNKTLTLTVDGTQNITITFNQNFTAQTNSQVLAFINAELGIYATASLYQRAKDYQPTWT